MMQGLTGDSEEVTFYFPYNGKPLKGCKWGDDKIHNPIYIFMRARWLRCGDCTEGKHVGVCRAWIPEVCMSEGWVCREDMVGIPCCL